MERLRVAVIGTGSIGRNHARVFSELPDVELVAVCDTDLSLVNDIADRYRTRAFTNYQEMLEKIKPDAVTIAVPTASHIEVAMAALEADVDLLVEKPIAATLDEGRKLIEKARSKSRLLMIGHIVRFNPAIQELKRRLQSGEVGRIFQIICRRVGPFPARIRDVGVVVDLAPHDLDMMRFLTDMEPIRVFCETEQRIHTDHEDLLLGLLRFPEGITAAIEINWLTPTKVREIIVLGERGMFRVDDLTQDLYFYENAEVGEKLWPALQNLKGVSEGSMTRYAVKRYEPLKAELSAFVHAIKDNTPSPVSGEDGLAALRLALALVESGLKHQVIEVLHDAG